MAARRGLRALARALQARPEETVGCPVGDALLLGPSTGQAVLAGARAPRPVPRRVLGSAPRTPGPRAPWAGAAVMGAGSQWHYAATGGLQAFHAAAQQAREATGDDTTSAKAAAVFAECWERLEAKYADRLQCPKEIVWLNGAPGSGKGANTPFILESRGLARAVTMSSLLERHPDIRALIDAGELVPDALVGDALLDVIFNPDEADGAGLLIDGFPRTALQVDLLKLLHDKMQALHTRHADSPDEWRFPHPAFKVVILYVDQDESVRRQMQRARMAALHNARVLDAGAGELWELRATDIDADKCRRRYEVFRAHYATVLRLKSHFSFSIIDSMGTLEETKAQILRELRYQSSLDLATETYAAIRHLPLATDLVRESRQQLVSSLDRYYRRHTAVFQRVIQTITSDVVPLLRRCALAGHAEYVTTNTLFSSALAAKIMIDVLTDRGFSVGHRVLETVVPSRIDLETGAIECVRERAHVFRITFERGVVRDVTATAIPATTHAADAAVRGLGAAIGTTIVPPGLDAGVRRTTPRSSLQDPHDPAWTEAEEAARVAAAVANAAAAPGSAVRVSVSPPGEGGAAVVATVGDGAKTPPLSDCPFTPATEAEAAALDAASPGEAERSAASVGPARDAAALWKSHAGSA